VLATGRGAVGGGRVTHCGRPVLSHRPNPKSLAARRARLRARQCLPLAMAPLAAGALPPMWKPGMGNDAANASTRLRISGMRGSTSSALPGAARAQAGLLLAPGMRTRQARPKARVEQRPALFDTCACSRPPMRWKRLYTRQRLHGTATILRPRSCAGAHAGPAPNTCCQVLGRYTR